MYFFKIMHPQLFFVPLYSFHFGKLILLFYIKKQLNLN